MTAVTQIKKGDQFWCLGQGVSQPTLGTVVALTSYSGQQIGLEFEEFNGGHSCGGRGKDKQCLWVTPADILSPAEYQAKLEVDSASSAADNAIDLEVLNLG